MFWRYRLEEAPPYVEEPSQDDRKIQSGRLDPKASEAEPSIRQSAETRTRVEPGKPLWEPSETESSSSSISAVGMRGGFSRRWRQLRASRG